MCRPWGIFYQEYFSGDGDNNVKHRLYCRNNIGTEKYNFNFRNGIFCDSYAAGGGPIVQPSFSLGVLGNSTKYVANWQCQNLKAANTLDSTKNFTVADQGETSLIITITGATGMTAMMGRAFVEGQMA